MFRSLLLGGCVLLTPIVAQATTVLTSFKPIQMIVTELTLDVTQPDVVMSNNASPHDYALKPSDVKKLNNADLFIWFGPELESFLTKVTEGKDNVLTISDIPNLPLREYGEQQHEEHEGHNHGSVDAHFWLGTEQVKLVAQAISQKLIERDHENTDIYKQNLKAFLVNLNTAEQDIIDTLNPIKDKGYYVFHDAYGYFEETYGLNNLGYFTVSPDRKPGAKTLIRIRKTLVKDNVQCVFSEPQFTPAVIESVTRGSNVRQGQLDPVGSSIEVKSGSYFTFIKGIANSYEECLANN
ncbi:zinc ABC transporter substrate-binding protein ZnuA [Vibrio sp. T187]|uniref:zinc ABC transporter substrate-binding protein ZnuA n=1 Tax=Vibrio TaxID=662 RepID=UPI0010C9F047|nr:MULTISPECIES: zinc ABC transporter substrate-binding protein ZnuA [Vibrio]MBW3694466.1 zinc ABC transporter substrate-binding protein ZnuA [Vibrio sp. T187]